MDTEHRLLHPIQRLRRELRRRTLFERFTVVVRVQLALAFLPSGAKKVAGVRFTNLPADTPVGSFFEAFFQADAYYAFVGLVQVAAALLLLWPRTALIGALLFLPVVTNILVITWSMQFQGTVYVAAALFAAVLYLLFWDADRLAPLFRDALRTSREAAPSVVLGRSKAALLTVVLGLLGLLIGGWLWLERGPQLVPLLLVVGAAVFTAFLAAGWETVARASRSS